MPRFDVTLAGELNLDLILYGLPDDLPPERELLADRMMLTLGSSSAIVAHNLSALGTRVGSNRSSATIPWGKWHWIGWWRAASTSPTSGGFTVRQPPGSQSFFITQAGAIFSPTLEPSLNFL